MVKNLTAMWETQIQLLGWEDPLKKEVASHSSILAWRIPCTEKHGRLQPMGSQRVRHNRVKPLRKHSPFLPTKGKIGPYICRAHPGNLPFAKRPLFAFVLMHFSFFGMVTILN